MDWMSPLSLPEVPSVGEPAPLLADWTTRLPALAAMAACPQDPVHHREGDVLTHTQMVCDQLVADPEWARVPASRREELWWAAILHDCAKPSTTREEEGRLRARGHAPAGAILARELLWRAGVAPVRRERVCELVRWHMTPYHLLDREDPTRVAAELSLGIIPADLALLTTSDARGRLADDVSQLTDTVELFSQFCAELGCLHGPYPFASDHSRVMYFRRHDRDINYHAYDSSTGELTILVGLPGAGKDRWAEEHASGRKVISLDALRREHGVRRGDHKREGRVRAAAREQLREQMRVSGSCVYNATNLSRQQRAPLLGLAADYNMRVQIVCIESPPGSLHAQNRNRAHPVPQSAIAKLLRRWEQPTSADAHSISISSRDGGRA